MLVRDEGYSRFPYKCTAGAITIGIGHNLEATPLPEPVILALLGIDIDEAEKTAKRLYGAELFESLSDNRKLALLNLCFNLGFQRLSQFFETNELIKATKWKEAAAQLLKSKYATQVKSRASRIAEMLEHDTFPYGGGK